MNITKKLLAMAALCGGLHAQVTIVNNASFRGDQPIAPGSWAAAFGTFAGVAATTASSFPLPKTLGGVTVKIDGVDAPLFDVRSNQITFLIPSAAAPGVRPVAITTTGGTVNGNVRIMASAPGLFVKDTATPPRGAARNQDGVTENSQSSPARRGEIISLFGTGPGPFAQTVRDGEVPGASPLVTTRATPQVFIGGVAAAVQFSGLNPNAPGLWQLNAVIPNLTFISGRTSVRVFMDGVDSNEVTIFVQ
jgi:uncharacterized protein (TIGR03437 family)